ncbi:hypothetical protein [Herbaspirillum aquaticum]|jgi:hypothetical protein|uniref:hypothetical protein n=1 Tax=Herbaspirillum aquaticum TaxID=568783 RepID=UPI0024DEF74D|nr:hypothetical protein [Herbaspirillum aquaticum]
MLFTFSATGTADLTALHFLNSNGEGRQAFKSYQRLIKAYKDLETAHELLSPIVDAIEEKRDNVEKIDWEKDSKAIGPRLTLGARDLYLGLLLRLEREDLYVRAYEDLTNVAAEHYPKMKLDTLLNPGEGFRLANLKQLPQVVVEALEKYRPPNKNHVPSDKGQKSE